MSFIIGKKCVSTCDTACVDVCPVDCIHGPIDIDGAGAEVSTLDSIEGLQLYINPDECIDCGVCEPECPADAILPDTEPDTEKWVEFNRKYSEIWPVIISQKTPLPDAEARDGEEGKLEKYFSEKPGEGG